MPAVPEAKVQIIEETPGKETQGHYGSETIVFNAPAATVTNSDVTLSLPIALLAAHLDCKQTNDGDQIKLEINPEQVVGTLDQSVSSALTVIPVPQSVIDLFIAKTLWLGIDMFLDDGTNKDALGTVLAYDDIANTVTVTTATTNSFLAGDYIKVTVTINPTIIGNGWVEITYGESKVISIGESKIGSTRIDAGSIIRVKYDNNHGSIQARPRILVEYLY